MYINNRQKKEDVQKDINDNNNDNNNENSKNKLKIFSKIKLAKPNKNISLLPKLIQKEKKLKVIGSSSDLMENKYQIAQKDKEDYKEELLLITNLWEELGVTKEYKKQFNKLLLNENLRKTMLYQEKENLQKFRNSLIKLRKEIINRENNIESLLKIIRALEGQIMEDNLLKEVVNIIKSLRLNAVNIVFYMMKVRELAFYNYFQGKWDLTKIKRDYLYNNSYLLKMKDDLYFLNNSILNNYIETNNLPTDPFLTNCIQRKNNDNNNNKIILPLTDELSKLIDQCEFIIMQDQLLDNIYNNNYSSQFSSRVDSGKIRIRKFSASNQGQSKGIFNNIKNKDLNNSPKKYSKNNIINLSKTIYQLKNENPSDYNNLFVNNQIPNLNINLKESRKMFESTRIKLRTKDKNKLFKSNINSFMNNYDNSKRIIIEHDILDSFNNKIKNDNNIKKKIIINCDENNLSSDNIENKLYKTNIENNNINSLEKENLKIIMNENVKLKKDNEEIKKELINSKKIMEKNENLRKNLENKLREQKEEMEKLSKSVEDIKLQLIKEKKEMEQKLKEKIEKNKGVEKINEVTEGKIKKENIVNKEIEMEIIEKNKIKRKENESIKEDNDYIKNNKIDENRLLSDKVNINKKNKYIENDKAEENKFINDNESELKEELDKKDNENSNIIYAITNSENEFENEKNKNIEANNDTKNKFNNELNNDDNNNNESIKNIEKSNEDMINDKSNEEEANKIIAKENDKIYAKQLSEKMVEEIINMKEYEISPNYKYKAEYYKGSIISLINSLKYSIPLENIDPKIKITFDIEKNLYNEESYLIGQYPLIIVCKSYEKESEITGICSFYYQNTAKNENKIKINFICAIQNNIDDKKNDDNIFEQFIAMINFIKNYVNFDELYITLNYKKTIIEEEKIQFLLEPKFLDFFKNQMGFSWFCIENIRGEGRRQQLCYKNNNKGIKQDINNYFNSESLFLLSFIKKDNIRNINYNFHNFKYMNNLPIYAILTSQKEFLFIDFKDNKYRFDSSKLNSKENPIINPFLPENKTLEELKSNLDTEKNKILNIIEDSLFLDNNNKYKEIAYSCGLFAMNLNIFFENMLITNINHYYYYRISSNEIEIIKDTKNDCVLYNIPTLNKINNVLIIEINNNKIKKLLLDNNKNIYELFIIYWNEINENEKIQKKTDLRNLYIPSFNIKTHLQTETFSQEINNINIQNTEENNKFDLKLGTLDEYLEINFNKKQIENQIFYEINKTKLNNDKDIIIKNDFIFCILNNYTEIKYPLFQLIYITKENWIKEGQNLE